VPYADKTKRNLSATQRRALLGPAAPPAGFSPVSISTDHQGAVRAVRSIPEGEQQHQPIVLEGHQIRFVTSLLDSEGNIKSQYVRGERDAADRYGAALAAVDRHFEALEARVRLPAPIAPPAPAPDDLQVTLLLGDPHIGMLSWHLETGTDFDVRIATAQLERAVDMLLARTPAAKQLVVANLGDFFHADDDRQLTPRGGNKLDVDGRAGKILDLGFGVLERCIERGLEKYENVVALNLPGNHDPRLSRVASRWLATRFRAEPRVRIVPNDDPYTFLTWGTNLHLFTHGDGAKPDALPAIMAAHDEGKLWGAHRHRMIYTGHIHHLQRREFPGVVWESSRTMAPGDYWHHHSGYRAGRGMRAVTHHKEHGHIREDLISAREVELSLENSP
jgi:hypothetical protein